MNNRVSIAQSLRAISLTLLLSALSSLSFAAINNLEISCPLNTEGERECSFSEGGLTASSHLVDLLNDMILFVEGSSANAGSYCQSTQTTAGASGFTHVCNLNDINDPTSEVVRMGCSTNGEQASCNLINNSGDIQEGLAIACDRANSSCTITTNTDAMMEDMQASVDMSDNMKEMAESLLSCVAQNTFGGMKAVCDSILSDLNNGDANAAMEKIIAMQPINPDTAIEKSLDKMMNTINAVSNRLSFLRHLVNVGGASSASANQIYYNGNFYNSGDMLADNGQLSSDVLKSNVSTGIQDFGRLSLYLNGSVTDGEYEAGAGLANDISSTVLVLGMDYRLDNNQVAGLAFNYGQDKTEFNKNTLLEGEVSADSFSLTAYYSYFKESWYVDSTLTLGGGNYDQERSPGLNLSDKLSATYHGQQTVASIAGGWQFYFNQYNLTPFAELTLGQLKTDRYKESGGAAAIIMDAQKRDIGTLQMGARLSAAFNTQRAVILPELSLRLVNDFEDESQALTGRWVGSTASGNDFTWNSDAPDSSYAVASVGLSFQLAHGNSGFLTLESIEGYDRLTQQRVSAGWRWEI